MPVVDSLPEPEDGIIELFDAVTEPDVIKLNSHGFGPLQAMALL